MFIFFVNDPVVRTLDSVARRHDKRPLLLYTLLVGDWPHVKSFFVMARFLLLKYVYY